MTVSTCIKMEVDETSSQVDVARLMSYNIYTDDEFPLRLRVLMEPIIQKYQFYNSVLDFNSTDSGIYDVVEQICLETYHELKVQLDEIPRTGSYYVDISVINFVNDYRSDPREFMQRFFKKFEIEKQLMSSYGDEVIEKLQNEMETSHREVLKELKWMLSHMDRKICGIKELDEFHDNILHNKEMINRPSKGGNPRVDGNTIEKLNLQKQTYMNAAESYKSRMKPDHSSLEEHCSNLHVFIEAFTSKSHSYLMEIRIRDRNLLNKALEDLKKKFSHIKEIFQRLRTSIDLFVSKFNSSQYAKFFSLPSISFDAVSNELGCAEYELYKNAVVVSVEPQFSMRCLKKEKKINQYELIVLFDRAHVTKNRIGAYLLTEAGLRRIRNELRDGKEPTVSDMDLGGKFRSKLSTLDQEDKRNGYKLTFKDLTITEANRKHKANLAVTQQKHAILFSGGICIDGIDVTIYCFSLPVIVAVHGNQMSKSLAAVFWDDNFYREERSGLEVIDRVNWPDVSNAIKHLFRRELGREPTPLNMQYLRERLQLDLKDAHGNSPDISFDAFLKAPSKNTKVSFWEWLWGSIQLLDGDATLRQLWNDDYIMGYINQSQAKTILNEMRSRKDIPLKHPEAERLFLIRFSESDKELITIQGHLFDQTKGWNVFSVKPYKSGDLQSISLSQRILDRQDCQTLLYQRNGEWKKAKKDEVFPCEQPEAETSLRYGYIAWTLKERTDDTDIRTFRIDPGDDETDVSEVNKEEDLSDMMSELNREEDVAEMVTDMDREAVMTDVSRPDDELVLDSNQSLLDWLLTDTTGAQANPSFT